MEGGIKEYSKELLWFDHVQF